MAIFQMARGGETLGAVPAPDVSLLSSDYDFGAATKTLEKFTRFERAV